MINRYYQDELANLRELAAEFAALHPALAPMLGRPSTDPDVERILEGVAFQTGLLREKLDDDFPELIHDLARLFCPQYLRPIPAATIVAFSPKASLTKSLTVPAGTQLASSPVEGTRCLFRTCWEVEVHPLTVVEAAFSQRSGEPAAVTISLFLNGTSLADWSPRSLRLFLADDSSAADLHLLLRRQLARIVLVPEEGGAQASLPPDCLQPSGWSENREVIPYPPQAFPGYRLLQEYLVFPQSFLFLDLTGWERWRDRGAGSRFSIRFELLPSAVRIPRVKRDSFVPSAGPAINLFPNDAAPILLDHRRERYPVRPDGLPPEHVQVFSVDRVTGYHAGTGKQRTYYPFELFKFPDEAAYHTRVQESPLGAGLQTELSVSYPQRNELPEVESLSAELTCSNGRLPERMRIGDLCEPTGSTPESVTFSNITTVTPQVAPPLRDNLLWRLVSHLSLNKLPLESAENLKSLLSLYLFEGTATLAANRKRIEAIEELGVTPTDLLVRGVPLRGREMTLHLRGDHFPGEGDLHLFCSVLDEFFACHAPLNSFTRLTVHDLSNGEITRWQPRLGQQALL